MSWVCTKCGKCCQHVDKVPSLAGYARPDGSCVFLGEDMLCTVYDMRPPVCNVAWIYENFFKGKVPEDEFYAMTQEACDSLRNGLISMTNPDTRINCVEKEERDE